MASSDGGDVSVPGVNGSRVGWTGRPDASAVLGVRSRTGVCPISGSGHARGSAAAAAALYKVFVKVCSGKTSQVSTHTRARTHTLYGEKKRVENAA